MGISIIYSYFRLLHVSSRSYTFTYQVLSCAIHKSQTVSEIINVFKYEVVFWDSRWANFNAFTILAEANNPLRLFTLWMKKKLNWVQVTEV